MSVMCIITGAMASGKSTSSNLVRTIRAVGPFAGLPPEVLANAIDETRDDLGLKLDTSHMSTQETIDAIVHHRGGH